MADDKQYIQFDKSPLNEVVLGIQFATPPGYQQIFAGKVWEIFREDFPIVREMPALPQAFETFGLSGVTSAPSVNFSLITGASHDRFWFTAPNDNELIQFQQDKLLHNWKKTADDNALYQSFDVIAKSFEQEINKLNEFFSSEFKIGELSINQCEISYINHIYVDESGPSQLQTWFSFLGPQIEANSINLAFEHPIYDEEEKPFARFHCQAGTLIGPKGRLVQFTLTVRGMPSQQNSNGVFEFFELGRKEIVKSFADLTTPAAHEKWGRKP